MAESINKFNAGSALWIQRYQLHKARPRLEKLAKTINRITDLGISQYAQLYAITLQFKPSLIIELGRGWGNSTAIFTQAANQLPQTRKVLSICLSNDWQQHISGKISQIVEPEWFDKLDARVANILDLPLQHYIRIQDSILFLWDAHGMDIAEHVLGKILPKLKGYKHLVLVHDVTDVRYNKHLKQYDNNSLWKKYCDDNLDNPYLIINNMASMFEEIIPILDFTNRNDILINSVEHDIRNFVYRNRDRKHELVSILGKNMASSLSSIHYFSLNSLPKKRQITFPAIKHPKNIKKNLPSYLSVFSSNLPLVSIVTPCFNSGKYLKSCIESVLNQTYPRVEHIIQDGVSTDNTHEIMEFYSQKKYHKKIKWVSEPDKGQADGLDKAIKRSSGEILLVLNADDELMADACTWGVTQLNNNPQCAAIYGDEFFIDENGKIFAIYEAKHPFDYKRLFCVELVPPAQAAFVRKSMLKDVGLYADATLVTCPDYEMWVRLGAKYPIRHEYGIVCKYRHHPESEGQQPNMVDKMIKAKLSVINRVLSSDNFMFSKIRNLRFRSYAGLYYWGANNLEHTGLYRKALICMLKSFFYRPQLHKAIRITKFLSFHIPHYIYQKLLD